MLNNVISAGSWQDIDYTFTYDDASTEFKIQVAQVGNLYADDLSLKEVLAEGYGGELLANGDFETNFAAAEEVRSLTASPYDGAAELRWVNPTDALRDKIAVYRQNEPIAELAADTASYIANGLTNGEEYVFTVRTKTPKGVLSEGVSVAVTPYKPIPLPKVIKDDGANIIVGLTEDMEYSLNFGGIWIKYNPLSPPDLSGDITVWVRTVSEYPGAPVQILNFTANAGAGNEITVENVSLKGNLFSLSGKLKENAVSTVTALVVKKGENRRNFDAVLLIGETKSSEDGEFSFTKSVADERKGVVNDGNYVVYIDSGVTGEIMYDGLVFVNSRKRLEAFDLLFGGADIAPLFEKSSQYYDAYISMGFTAEEYNENPSVKAKTLTNFKAALAGIDKNAQNAEEITINAFTGAYVAAAMEKTDGEGAYALVKKHNNALGLRYSEDITCEKMLSANGGDIAWAAGYMAGKTYNGNEDLDVRFKEACALYFINTATYGVIADIIAGQKQFLNLGGADYDKYMAMPDKTEAGKKIILLKNASGFNSGAEVLSAISTALSSLPSVSPGGVPLGGGTGGGGGATAVPIHLPYVGEPDEPPAADEVFSDLGSVPWAKDGILYLYEKGFVKGYGDGGFVPGSSITREEFVTMLVRAFGLYDENAVSEFSDVSASDWFYKTVSSGVNAGIISGIGDNLFGSGQNITRQDLAVLAYRCIKGKYGLAEIETEEFSDFDLISGYAREAVLAAKGFHIINGYGDGSFRPRDTATRAEAAMILYRIVTMGETGQ
jgi:hypothetical protein